MIFCPQKERYQDNCDCRDCGFRNWHYECCFRIEEKEG